MPAGRIWNCIFSFGMFLSDRKPDDMSEGKLDEYFQSAFEGDISNIEKHLSSGNSPNEKTPDGRYILHVAVEGGDVQALKLLLDRGALVNSKGFNGYTALHIAVHNSLDQVVQENLDPGTEDPEVVELLLLAGADIHLKDEDSRSALEIAEIYKSNKLVDLLAAYA